MNPVTDAQRHEAAANIVVSALRDEAEPSRSDCSFRAVAERQHHTEDVAGESVLAEQPAHAYAFVSKRSSETRCERRSF